MVTRRREDAKKEAVSSPSRLRVKSAVPLVRPGREKPCGGRHIDMRTEETTLKDLMNPGAAEDFFTRRTMPPFEPDADPKEFNLANALWLMELSRLVYRREKPEPNPHPTPRTKFLGPQNLKETAFFNEKDSTADTQAILVQSTGGPQWAALVFRGTERKPTDVITDLKFSAPHLGSGPIVHRGFEHALDIVWNDIEKELKKVQVPLFMTGHSLGAALATLAAARHAPRAVYTFGSPLVGNHAFVETMQGVPIHRVVDDNDGVTFVPPEFLGYEHVGVLRHIFEIPPPPLLLHLEKIAFDHAPVNYVDRLK
jgi:triacylglycerol lipase